MCKFIWYYNSRYLAEKIYADKIKDAAINQTIHETPNIVIPLFKNIMQTRKGSMDWL